MGNIIIEILRFSFFIEGKKILKDISVAVRKGEHISIVGPNGAGKSTLLKCLGRIYKGGSGYIRIAGQPIDKYRQKELAREVSYIPQADGSNSPFTVYEFVTMGRYPYMSLFPTPSKKDRDAVYNALAMTGTLDLADRFINTLSGGERQKVFIAAAFVQGAKILLLDEPTTFLDPKHEADVNRLLTRVNREHGVTILSVTHDINRAVLASTRVLALKKGTVVFFGHGENLMDNRLLQKIYGRPFQFMKHPKTGNTIIAPEVS